MATAASSKTAASRKPGSGWKSLGSDKEILKESPADLRSDYEKLREMPADATETERREKVARQKIHFSARREVFARRRKENAHGGGFIMKEAMEDSKDVRSQRDLVFDVIRKEVDYGVQVITQVQNKDTQTPSFRKIDACLQAEPEVVDARLHPGKEDPTMPIKMKKFFDKAMPRILHHLTLNDRVPIHGDDYLRLTDEDTFVASREDNFLQEKGNYQHTYTKKRQLTSIDWRPGTKSVLALSTIAQVPMTERATDQRLVESSVALVWNTNDPMHPQCVLESPTEVLCIRFNPSAPNLVIGGLINGQIVVWDISQANDNKPKQHAKIRAPQNMHEDVMHIPKMSPPLKGVTQEKDGDAMVSRLQPMMVSRAEYSHKRAVHDICFFPESMECDFHGRLEPGQGDNQFASISEDGHMMIWDLRPERQPQDKLRKIKQTGGGGGKTAGSKGGASKSSGGSEEVPWVPLHKVPLQRPDGSGDALGLRLHLEGRLPNGQPSYIMVCTTVEGELCSCYYGPKDEKQQQNQYGDDAAATKAKAQIVRSIATAHAGPAWAVQRHPQLPEYYLTVGDWGFKIWKQGLTTPIVSSPQGENNMLCGRWSPTRASVVVIGTSDGFIQVWDLLDRSHEPTLVHRLSSDPISVIEFKPLGAKTQHGINQLLVVGKIGSFHLFDLPKVLVKGQTHEVKHMKALLEREVRRVAYFNWRWRERQKEMDRHVQEKADVPDGSSKPGQPSAAKLKLDEELGLDDDYSYDPEADLEFQKLVDKFGEEEDSFEE